MASVRVKNGKLFIDYRVNGIRKNEFLRLDDNRENRKIAELRRKEIEYEIASGVYKERFRKKDINNKLLNDGYQEFLAENLARKKFFFYASSSLQFAIFIERERENENRTKK